ncbi:MAG: DUF928 domain-containing protein [Cyanobacteria bacterium P01_G01_bin.38]
MCSVNIVRYGLLGGLLLFISPGVSPGVSPLAYAQSQPADPAATPPPIPSQAPQRVMRPSPPRRLPPNRVQPGGGLDADQQACSNTTEALTALVPVDNPVMTALPHPSFWFYIPDSPDLIQSGEFILLSADEKTQMYNTQVALANGPGLIRVPMPAELASGLSQDTYYHWYFNVTCQAPDGEGAVLSVNGWIYRSADGVDPAPPDNNPVAHWYDTLDQAALRLSEAPQDSSAQQAWADLLTAGELGELIDKPIVDTAHLVEE